MDNKTLEKFAGLFANCAVTGRVDELRKEAADEKLIPGVDPVTLGLGSLAGASIGGLGGYFGTSDEKRKKRNALYGALSGGILGMGVPLMLGGNSMARAATGSAGPDGAPGPAGAGGKPEKPEHPLTAPLEEMGLASRKDSPWRHSWNFHNIPGSGLVAGGGYGLGLWRDRVIANRSALRPLRENYDREVTQKLKERFDSVASPPKPGGKSKRNAPPPKPEYNDSIAQGRRDLGKLVDHRHAQTGWFSRFMDRLRLRKTTGYAGEVSDMLNVPRSLRNFLQAPVATTRAIRDANAVARHIQEGTVPIDGDAANPGSPGRRITGKFIDVLKTLSERHRAANPPPTPPPPPQPKGKGKKPPPPPKPKPIDPPDPTRAQIEGRVADAQRKVVLPTPPTVPPSTRRFGPRAAVGGVAGAMAGNQDVMRWLYNNFYLAPKVRAEALRQKEQPKE